MIYKIRIVERKDRQGTTVSQPADNELKVLDQVVETQTLIEADNQKLALTAALQKYKAILERSIVTAKVDMA